MARLASAPYIQRGVIQRSLHPQLRRINHPVKISGLITDRAVAFYDACEVALDVEGDFAAMTLTTIDHLTSSWLTASVFRFVKLAAKSSNQIFGWAFRIATSHSHAIGELRTQARLGLS